MKNLILIIFLFCSLFTLGQTSEIPKEKTQISSDTYIQASGEKSFRVITTDSVYIHDLMQESIGEFQKIVIVTKEDRLGLYYEYSVYFENSMYKIVRDLIEVGVQGVWGDYNFKN